MQYRRYVKRAATGLLLLLFPLSAAPTIRDCATEFYDIEGDNGTDLLKEMKTRNGIKGGFFALTSYRYRIQCRNLTLTCKVRLPRWQGRATSTSKELNEKWDKFYEGLVAHEQGHVDIFFEGMRPVEAAIENMACAAAHKYAKKEYNKQSKAQKSFDEETKHGTLKGASFAGSNYLAVAYSQKIDAIGFAYDQETKAAAKSQSLKACKAKDCKFLTWANGEDKCIALAVNPETAYGSGWGSGSEDARKKAVASCGKFGKDCKVRAIVCAGEGEVSD